MEIATYILSVVTVLLGGANILQFFTIRSYKRKHNAEATRAEIDNLNIVIDNLKKEVERLEKRLTDLEGKVCYDTDCKKRI